MSPTSAPPTLCAALVWGSSVVALRHLAAGESLELGEIPGALAPKPAGIHMADCPLRARAGGWELDLSGAGGGILSLGSVELSVEEAARGSTRSLARPGDHGLIQYGEVALFFQISWAAPRLPRRRRMDANLFAAVVFAATAALGGLALLKGITSPSGAGRPLQLVSSAQLYRTYRVRPEPAATITPSTIAASREARLTPREHRRSAGAQDDAARIEPAVRSIADVLRSDTGDELRRALASIPPLPEKPWSRSRVHAASEGPPRAGADGEGLGIEAIDGAIKARLGLFRACFDAARAHDPRLAGVVSLSFGVLPSGAVAHVAVASSSLEDEGVERCLVERFRGLAFPTAQRRTHASFAFEFSATDP